MIKVGIPLELDVDFIDISTCESVPVSSFRINPVDDLSQSLFRKYGLMAGLATLLGSSKSYLDSPLVPLTNLYTSSGYEQASSQSDTGSGGDPSGIPSGSGGGVQPTGTAGGSSSQESGAYAGADSPDSSIASSGPTDSDVRSIFLSNFKFSDT